MGTAFSSAGPRGVTRRAAWFLLVAAIAGPGLLAGCAQIRKATYPSDFVYLDSKTVKGEMALMALYLRQIDEALADEVIVSSEQQARLIRLLTAIDQTTDRLAAGSVTTNHRTIDDNIDRFKRDVNVALHHVSSDPPNYYALGKLAGSCAACHQHR